MRSSKTIVLTVSLLSSVVGCPSPTAPPRKRSAEVATPRQTPRAEPSEGLVVVPPGPPSEPPDGTGGDFSEPAPSHRVEPDICRADAFGTSLAAVGDELLIGAPTRYGGEEPGCAALVTVDTNGVRLKHVFRPVFERDDWDSFGMSVALSAEHVAVGQWGTDADDGPVEVYSRAAGWAHTASLMGDPPATSTEGYGQALLFAEQSLLVGHPGGANSVHEFRWRDDEWSLTTSLRGAHDDFGGAVAWDGDYLAVADPLGAAVHLHERHGNGWRTAAIVRAPPGANEPRWVPPAAVTLAGDWLAVGLPLLERGGYASDGRVHVFRRSGDHWRHVHTLRSPTSPTIMTQFGQALESTGDLLLVSESGSPRHGVAGSVWVYRWNEPSPMSRLREPEGRPYGTGLALVGDQVAIGSHGVGSERAVVPPSVLIFEL